MSSWLTPYMAEPGALSESTAPDSTMGISDVQQVWPGRPFPLGPTFDGRGTNFALFSENAEGVELCLFDENDEETLVEVGERTAFVWHCYLPGVGPGQRYGYRVRAVRAEPRSAFQPGQAVARPVREGHRRAGAVQGRERAAVRSGRGRRRRGRPRTRRRGRRRRDAEGRVVIDETFDWEGDRQLNRPWSETVIYETHVKGFTKLDERVREDLRGTYAGLASEEAIEYLRDLGVTAVELQPVHHIADEAYLVEKGLTNYWGYSSIGYFAPHSLYSATGARGEQLREFKGMVKALHRAGIEVILDVVYNHTAEGNHLGPMLSFRGIDNRSYYRLSAEDPRYYVDYTGTGNSLNPVHPSVLRLIMDSLRYFVGRVPRRRVPLRPRGRARPGVPRGRPALGVLRHHLPGPDPVAGEADRRAVGRRRRRLPGRQLPGVVDRVERSVPRRRARLLAGSGPHRRLHRSLRGLGRPLPA